MPFAFCGAGPHPARELFKLRTLIRTKGPQLANLGPPKPRPGTAQILGNGLMGTFLARFDKIVSPAWRIIQPDRQPPEASLWPCSPASQGYCSTLDSTNLPQTAPSLSAEGVYCDLFSLARALGQRSPRGRLHEGGIAGVDDAIQIDVGAEVGPIRRLTGAGFR